MFQREINEQDVREVLATGETIETYPDDIPYPSRLVLGWRGLRPLHDNPAAQERIVITVYEPDAQQWELEFRRRRQ